MKLKQLAKIKISGELFAAYSCCKISHLLDKLKSMIWGDGGKG